MRVFFLFFTANILSRPPGPTLAPWVYKKDQPPSTTRTTLQFWWRLSKKRLRKIRRTLDKIRRNIIFWNYLMIIFTKADFLSFFSAFYVEVWTNPSPRNIMGPNFLTDLNSESFFLQNKIFGCFFYFLQLAFGRGILTNPSGVYLQGSRCMASTSI